MLPLPSPPKNHMLGLNSPMHYLYKLSNTSMGWWWISLVEYSYLKRRKVSLKILISDVNAVSEIEFRCCCLFKLESYLRWKMTLSHLISYLSSNTKYHSGSHTLFQIFWFQKIDTKCCIITFWWSNSSSQDNHFNSI